MPCFASTPQRSLNSNNSPKSNKEEEEDYAWLEEIFEKLNFKAKNNNQDDCEEEEEEEEEFFEDLGVSGIIEL